MKNSFNIALESYIDEYGSINSDVYNSLSDIFIEGGADGATKTPSKGELIAELTRKYNELKNCPGISDKITLDELKSSRKEVQSAITTFRAVLQKFVKVYNKILKDGKVTTESAADDANKEVRKLLALSDAKAKAIKSDKSMDKVSKAKALKDVIKAKASGVKVALTALDHTFKEFISAVKKDDENIKEEYKILDMQLKLFTQQYEALTGYVIDNAPFIAAVGLTICMSTASVVMNTGATIANVQAGSLILPAKAGKDLMNMDGRGKDFDGLVTEVRDILVRVDKQAGEIIGRAKRKGLIDDITTAGGVDIFWGDSELHPDCQVFEQTFNEFVENVRKLSDYSQRKISEELVKRGFATSAATALGISAAAALANKVLNVKTRKGYNPMSFTHKEDILSKATNNASMKRKEEKLKRMRDKRDHKRDVLS